jgi:glyoxylase-like metal-dependent hydrolase (beta-lactamase superfamily II)
MRLLNDLYIYPWTSFQENNCNTVFIDGAIPVIIDPGHMHLFNHVNEGLVRDGKSIDSVRCLLCTHSHPDHIEAIDRFDRNVLKGIGRLEYEYLNNGGKELFIATGSQITKMPFKIFLKPGVIRLGDKTFRVIHTPGHSPGSICLYWEEEKVLISGDTIFYMGVGRTDLPGGDIESLAWSIKELSGLPIDFLIPGHGEIVRGKEAIHKNFSVILGEFFE